jgi:hypothetical protein
MIPSFLDNYVKIFKIQMHMSINRHMHLNFENQV